MITLQNAHGTFRANSDVVRQGLAIMEGNVSRYEVADWLNEYIGGGVNYRNCDLLELAIIIIDCSQSVADVVIEIRAANKRKLQERLLAQQQ